MQTEFATSSTRDQIRLWFVEPRLSVGIPIVGCPDYLALMQGRAKASGLQFGPPILPDSLLELIERESPVSTTGRNPFFGKKILVLAGGKDELVPWVFSESFVERIEVGEGGVKKVVVYPDVGHTFTPTMEEEVADFVWEEGCRQEIKESLATRCTQPSVL